MRDNHVISVLLARDFVSSGDEVKPTSTGFSDRPDDEELETSVLTGAGRYFNFPS